MSFTQYNFSENFKNKVIEKLKVLILGSKMTFLLHFGYNENLPQKQKMILLTNF